MRGLALAMTVDRENVVAKAKAERRRFVRVPVDLAGRLFVPGDGREAKCKVVDLSPGGAQLASDLMPAADTNIIVYIDGFGRFEGVVIRPTSRASASSSIAPRSSANAWPSSSRFT